LIRSLRPERGESAGIRLLKNGYDMHERFYHC
jgi:hypothetical protein